MNNSPNEIWEQYAADMKYKTGINLYNNVKSNENFFIGKQWEDVNAPSLNKPVLNFIQTTCTHSIAMLVSDDIAANFTAFNSTQQTEHVCDIVSNEVERIIENTKMKAKCREALRNAYVDGDGIFYINYNPTAKTGQTAEGEIAIELIDNTNVHFGNPYSAEIQEQPYIIFSLRKYIDNVKRMAKANGIAEYDQIVSDSDISSSININDKLVTVLVKVWKDDNGNIWTVKSTQNIIIEPPKNTMLKLYPIAKMSWTTVKNSCHGESAVTAIRPNQIMVNKIPALAELSIYQSAFPRIAYDKQKITSYSNDISKAIAVQGDPSNVIQKIGSSDMSSQVIQLMDIVMSRTKDLMGATDAALGNVNPNNTSAIIATQKASAVPLELQRLAYYDFVEDTVRVFVDMMSAYYGVRYAIFTNDVTGDNEVQAFDYSILNELYLQLNIDIGASAYWNEIVQTLTTENLYNKGIIKDPELFLESVPPQNIRNRGKIIKELQKAKEMGQQTQFAPHGIQGLIGNRGPQGAPGILRQEEPTQEQIPSN